MPLTPGHFTSRTLRQAPWGPAVARILAAAIAAVEPGAAVEAAIQRRGSRLAIAGREYDLDQVRRVFLVAVGKASAPMAQAAAQILGSRLSGGVVITKDAYSESPLPSLLRLLQAGHPLPDERSVQAAQQVTALLEEAQPGDLLLALISGGGSALLAAPASGIHLQDLQALTAALLACGADIHAINTLRKHLDQLKGGGLARQAAPAQVAALILSDVVGDSLEVIASGLTAPDPSTFSDALQILRRYGLLELTPPAILARLRAGERGELPETPKPGDPLFAQVHNAIIASNRQAAQAALGQAQAEGFQGLLLTTCLQGEARQAGRALAALLQQASAGRAPLSRPLCLLAGGETTVTLRGSGLGGRNQELALGAVSELAGLPNLALLTLATDGGDGPTDAAGAAVTGETLARAQQLGLDPTAYLARNDAYHFFAALDDLLKPGPTHTNVNDLTFLFAF
ncbi:MAG: DUF4147 domain-containing protein [Chloroflexota bacterium]